MQWSLKEDTFNDRSRYLKLQAQPCNGCKGKRDNTSAPERHITDSNEPCNRYRENTPISAPILPKASKLHFLYRYTVDTIYTTLYSFSQTKANANLNVLPYVSKMSYTSLVLI